MVSWGVVASFWETRISWEVVEVSYSVAMGLVVVFGWVCSASQAEDGMNELVEEIHTHRKIELCLEAKVSHIRRRTPAQHLEWLVSMLRKRCHYSQRFEFYESV